MSRHGLVAGCYSSSGSSSRFACTYARSLILPVAFVVLLFVCPSSSVEEKKRFFSFSNCSMCRCCYRWVEILTSNPSLLLFPLLLSVLCVRVYLCVCVRELDVVCYADQFQNLSHVLFCPFSSVLWQHENRRRRRRRRSVKTRAMAIGSSSFDGKWDAACPLVFSYCT